MRYLFSGVILLFISLMAFSPSLQFTVTGTVLDSSGAPIVGATVSVKGGKITTTTAADGSFSLVIPSESATLIIQAVGFESQKISVTSTGKKLNVKMKYLSSHLEEADDSMYSPKLLKRKTDQQYESYRVLSPRELNGSVSGVPIQDMKLGNHKGFKVDDQNKSWRNNNNFNTEEYDAIVENRFLEANSNPLSTFSIDVDGASYANVRRFLQMGQLPQSGAVRIEELINYFHYDYPQPSAEDPFSINTEIADCPWSRENKLVMIGLQGRKISTENLPASNLVFLVDVSGSMFEPNKLPLVQASLKLLVDQLRNQDRVTLVVYAGNAGLVMPSTSGSEKQKIKDAIDRLEAGGSTAGGAGIKLAYKIAKENFVSGGNNRVILCTDGDFNVGASSDSELEKLIEEERKTGVFLTILGYGMGNYKDSKMEKLADKGNGNHAYIDNFNEARKVLVNEFGGTLFTIAKDVKLQVEFNPAKVQAYRLIGYENRMLNKEDFNNDQKDAGELGSGHTVTALYEIIPVGVKSHFIEKTDKLKYQQQQDLSQASHGTEIMTIKFRYKKPDEDKSKLIEHSVIDQHLMIEKTSDNFRFVSALAQFGLLLRNSEFKEESSYDRAWNLAKGALGKDVEGYRSEFLKLLRNAESLAKGSGSNEEEEKEDLGSK